MFSVCCAVEAFKKMVVGQKLADIFGDFGKYWQSIVNEDQIRWVGNWKSLWFSIDNTILSTFI